MDSEDEVVADWQMNGYGKLASGMMPGHETPIQEAMDIAVRDVGAQLAIGFTNQPQIRDWMEDR